MAKSRVDATQFKTDKLPGTERACMRALIEKRDFADIEQFGLQTVTPADFLRSIGALP